VYPEHPFELRLSIFKNSNFISFANKNNLVSIQTCSMGYVLYQINNWIVCSKLQFIFEQESMDWFDDPYYTDKDVTV
jgi:hypothetical protein